MPDWRFYPRTTAALDNAAREPIPCTMDQIGRFAITVERDGGVVLLCLQPHLPRPGATIRIRLAPTCARELATALGKVLPRRGERS